MVKGLPSEWGSCFRTVSLEDGLSALSYWENTIAVGCWNSDIITLDAITGSQMAVLSGHTDWVECVIFSSDGRSLASGSDDKTVKLWDVQTGGVIKTFYGHKGYVYSVSISGDCTRIVSGSRDCTIHLWDIQTGESIHTIKQWRPVDYACFYPMDPQHIISISGKKVRECDISSQQMSSLYHATSLAFSPDYTQLALCFGEVVAVQNFNSGEIAAQFNVAGVKIRHCCFSPDGKLIAAAAEKTAYVWSITGSDCCLVETFVGHTKDIQALVFLSPSSLISASGDRSVKFWQIGALSENKTVTDPESAPLTLPLIQSVSLQAGAGIAISSDKAGVVKTWDLSTGLCKASYQSPVGDRRRRDVQLIDSRLVTVWYEDSKIQIWDTSNDKLLRALDIPQLDPCGIRISGDGSKVFCLAEKSIQAWSIETGEHVGKIESERFNYLDPFRMGGSRIWIQLKDLSTQGWDFGTSSASHVPSSIASTERPLLDITGTYLPAGKPFQIKISGKVVFELSGKHENPREVWWDGQYLIAGYYSGELLILDFHHMYPK